MYTSGVPQQRDIATFIGNGQKSARGEAMNAISDAADEAKNFADEANVFEGSVDDRDCVVINSTKRREDGTTEKTQERYEKSLMGQFGRWLAGRSVTEKVVVRVSPDQAGTASPSVAVPVVGDGEQGLAESPQIPAEPTGKR